MSHNYLISDAAKQVEVEAHVLRYWEEELGLPIKRNELGHRYYTEEDLDRFREIKNMKEKGLQLKAIRMVLKDGKLDMVGTTRIEHSAVYEPLSKEEEETDAIQFLQPSKGEILGEESREDKAKRLQWLLQQLFRETLQENNRELCQMVKEHVVKELDYQFRAQEEKEEERYGERMKREEEHYKKIDELLRKKRRLLRK